MPYMKPDKPAGFSWDAFPELPPEAENWVPDPDSIARPGKHPHLRLSQNPYAKQKEAALKRDARIRGLAGFSGSSTSSTSSNEVAAGRAATASCPIQVPRTFLPQSLQSLQSRNSEHMVAKSAPETPEAEGSELGKTNFTVVQKATPTERAGDALGKTKITVAQETVFNQGGGAQSNAAVPQTPVVLEDNPAHSSIIQGSDTLPAETYQTNRAQAFACDHTPMPSWAGPLEKLLRETRFKAAPSGGPVQRVPPHLRNSNVIRTIEAQDRTGNADQPSQTTVGNHPLPDLEEQLKAANEATHRVSGTSEAEALANDEDTVGDDVLAWRMVNSDSAITNAKEVRLYQGPRLQQPMVPPPKRAQIAAPRPTEAIDRVYQREIDVKLYRILEDEMDSERRATRAELFTMDDELFASYLAKAKSAHRKWWMKDKDKKLAQERYAIDPMSFSSKCAVAECPLEGDQPRKVS